MDKQEFYTVGEVSNICNLSKKTLRYYDEIGLLSPDKVSSENNYRYYSNETMLMVPILKYYKQMGFKLKEVKGFLGTPSENMWDMISKFDKKMYELEEAKREIDLQMISIKDWHNLVLEAQVVLKNNITEVCVKFISEQNLCFLEQKFMNNYMDSIINIEFTNYICGINNSITGPVIIKYENYNDKFTQNESDIKVMQKLILEPSCETEIFGGCMAVCCYHIGEYENIDKTYIKVEKWIHENNYKCAKYSYERYVTDYWTTKNKENFVTEIIIPIEGKGI